MNITDFFDALGNLHIGPFGRLSKARITVDMRADDTDGIALDVAPTRATAARRAAIALGDYIFGQDTAKTGSKNFGILNSSGVLVAALADANGLPASKQIKYATAIPLIIAPTGTMGDNGALTSGTANPLTYLKSYTYLPIGAIYTASPAGWYWTVWADTTTAVVYQETWDGASTPTAVASPTAWAKTGPGAFTGATTEALYIALPMAALNVNSSVMADIEYAMTNNANAKSSKVRFTNLAGTVLSTMTLTSFAYSKGQTELDVTGVADKQRATFQRYTAAAFLRDAPILTSEVTSAAWAIAICAARADATDVIVIEQITVTQTG